MCPSSFRICQKPMKSPTLLGAFKLTTKAWEPPGGVKSSSFVILMSVPLSRSPDLKAERVAFVPRARSHVQHGPGFLEVGFGH